MKSHPEKRYEAFHGVDLSYAMDRIDDRSLAQLYNAWCDRTGQIQKAYGHYPVTKADAFYITTASEVAKLWIMARYRGKNSNARALAVLGDGLFMSVPNDLYDQWGLVTYVNFQADPALDQACAISYRNRYGYVQNIDDLPFRVKMEEDDGSDVDLVAEPLGLRPPPYSALGILANTVGATFPASSITAYAVTYVYGDRGESGPGPVHRVKYAAANALMFDLNGLPIGPTGVTKRRIYRSQIGHGKRGAGTDYVADPSLWDGPTVEEMFLLAEINDNTTTTFTDTVNDNALDFTRRMPPARMFPPRSKYQTIHLDRIFWAHLREHPWVMQAAAFSAPGAALAGSTITISNTGNGTITIARTAMADIVVANYKTLSLSAIRALINVAYNAYNGVLQVGPTSTNLVCRVMAGVDDTRKYVFREVTAHNILGSANAWWFEAIDGDTVATEGCEFFRNRIMFSDLAFVEEVNPFNQFEIAKDDAYPITNMQIDDFTLCVATQNKWWLVSGDFVPNQLFVPNFAVSASRAEHGSLCVRPDACCSTPYGIFFISLAGLRLLRGGSDAPAGIEIDKLLMERLLIEPRTRDNPCMLFEADILRIAFPANVTI